MATFREQVEALVQGVSACGEENCLMCQKFVDKILAAHNKRLDEIAEGMPKLTKSEIKKVVPAPSCSIEGKVKYWHPRIATAQKKKCQAYIQAQKEGM